ncbi:MAG: DUF2520 domain-containing protein [Oscillospiraceae bacterium]|nr:DUF2520 domain-containing protein [Oscillospiraceae bacterium]
MKIGFIGAGRVGFSLGKFFAQGGVPLTGYYSRQRESAQEAALFTHTRPYDSLASLVQESDALFLTVPDRAILPVYRSLEDFELSEKQICHCSGVLTAGEAFPGIGQRGACGYSIHPLFPISSKYETYRELADAFFCLEGTGPHLERWKSMLQSLGPTVQILPAERKVRYHAACTIASNLVCALVQESLELLETCGFSQEEGLRAITPLLRSNITHILQDGPIQALTGPVERCDTATAVKHLACLPDRETQLRYRTVSQKLVQMARQKHPELDYGPLLACLKEEKEGSY